VAGGGWISLQGARSAKRRDPGHGRLWLGGLDPDAKKDNREQRLNPYKERFSGNSAKN